MKTYFYCTGGKGGIGKSLMATLLVDYKSENGQVLLIDADPVNADSSAAYKAGKVGTENVRAIRARIRSEDSTGQVDTSGLIETLNLADAETATAIVVDAPAGDSVLLTETGTVITGACKQAGIKSVFVWLVDANDRTPVNALHAAWDSIKEADQILLVKNNRKSNSFEFFDGNATVIEILKSGNVQVMELPKIAARIEEHLRIERMTWREVATATPLGNRIEGERLRRNIHNAFRDAGI